MIKDEVEREMLVYYLGRTQPWEVLHSQMSVNARGMGDSKGKEKRSQKKSRKGQSRTRGWALD